MLCFYCVLDQISKRFHNGSQLLHYLCPARTKEWKHFDHETVNMHRETILRSGVAAAMASMSAASGRAIGPPHWSRLKGLSHCWMIWNFVQTFMVARGWIVVTLLTPRLFIWHHEQVILVTYQLYITTSTGWSGTKFCMDIHGSQMMYPPVFGDPLTFLPARKAHICGFEWNALTNIGHICLEMYVPLRMYHNNFGDPLIFPPAAPLCQNSDCPVFWLLLNYDIQPYFVSIVSILARWC